MKFRARRTTSDSKAKRVSARRFTALYFIFLAMMLPVAAAVARIQIRHSEQFRREALSNMFCDIPLPALRGDITDRNGTVLAEDGADFRAITVGKNCAWKEIPDLRPGKIAKHLYGGAPYDPEMLELIRTERFSDISSLVENPQSNPGAFVDIVPVRNYPLGNYTAHIVGFIGEIGRDEQKSLRGLGYLAGDRTGKSGAEKWYEARINGKRGSRRLVMDAPGHILTVDRISWPRKGATLALTIDARLQKAAYDAFERRGLKGAAVFMDSRTGQVLAMVSAPSFSPEPGPDGLTPAAWSRLASNSGHPLLNRAIASSMPPGSVFKLVEAAAALEEGIVNPDSVFTCPGFYALPGRAENPPKCNAVHGRIDLVDGISKSCDVVFYALGQKLGVEKIKKYAGMFGLGTKTGIDLPGENGGLVPDENWKKKFGGGGRWTAGDTLNLSIGQGNMQVTPVQIARMVNVFATRGMLVTPHIALDGSWPVGSLSLKPETLEAVRRGMRGAVLSGTCQGISDFAVSVAAKTGTAQSGTAEKPLPPHAWFAGFAPYENPVITFAVYVEHGGYGADAALPIAREVLEMALKAGYFEKQ